MLLFRPPSLLVPEASLCRVYSLFYVRFEQKGEVYSQVILEVLSRKRPLSRLLEASLRIIALLRCVSGIRY